MNSLKKIDLGEPLTKTTDSFMVPEEKKDDRDPFSVGQSETGNEEVSSSGGACATIGVSSSTAADRSRQARLALRCVNVWWWCVVGTDRHLSRQAGKKRTAGERGQGKTKLPTLLRFFRSDCAPLLTDHRTKLMGVSSL